MTYRHERDALRGERDALFAQLAACGDRGARRALSDRLDEIGRRLGASRPPRLPVLGPACGIGWETMAGGPRARTCSGCGERVLDPTALDPEERAALCVENRVDAARLRRRSDGRLQTGPCTSARPVLPLVITTAAIASVLVAIVVIVGARVPTRPAPIVAEVPGPRTAPAPVEPRTDLTGSGEIGAFHVGHRAGPVSGSHLRPPRYPSDWSIHGERTAILDCYERQLRTTPGLVGRIALDVVVDATGTVRGTPRARSEPALELVAACVARVVVTIPATRPPGVSTEWHLVLDFHPRGEEERLESYLVARGLLHRRTTRDRAPPGILYEN